MLSCNPSEPGCVVVAMFVSSEWESGFYRVSDPHWTELKSELVGPSILDFTYQNNWVYTINCENEVIIYDLQNLSVRTFASNLNHRPRSYCQINLVEGDAESGGPFLVRKKSDFTKNTIISVHKWTNDGRPEWRELRNIGKQVLFLNQKHSTNLQLENWRGNQICYDMKDPQTRQYFEVGIKLVNLENEGRVGNITSLGVFHAEFASALWFTPSLI